MAQLPETLTQETLDDWSQAVTDELGLHTFFLTLYRDGGIVLNNLIVPRDSRKMGTGSAAMEQLLELADTFGVQLWLSPAERDPHHGTTSRNRLIQFYQRFGFVRNRGRNKDYRHMESMYRRPLRSNPSDSHKSHQPHENYGYLGQCDRLRMAGYEDEWQQMMRQRVPIEVEEFTDAFLGDLLDPDETLEDFIGSDPDSGFYRSVWGDVPCKFIQTCGFEFIFVPEQYRLHQSASV